MKILIFAGTRPEIIKMAPVYRKLKSQYTEHEVVFCAVGQHKELLLQALEDFAITPEVTIQAAPKGHTLAQLSAYLFHSIDCVLENERPDWVLIQGDTTTVMVASMCAFYRRIPIGHIEAGLRSHNKYSPFPEEINRRIAGLTANLHFAPTEISRNNLLAEGVASTNIIITGNTVIDSLHWIRDELHRSAPNFPPSLLPHLNKNKKIILVTSHRRENNGTNTMSLCSALRFLATSRKDILVVFCLHMNPVARQPVIEELEGRESIVLLDPQPYKTFVSLLASAYMVITDSGGIQEEATAFFKPVLVLRTETERPEGIAAGAAKLTGVQTESIINDVLLLLDDSSAYNTMAASTPIYGDGKAASKICTALFSSEFPHHCRHL